MAQGWNDIINAIDNLKPFQQRATININKPGIISSVPNYKLEKTLGRIGSVGKNIGKAGGILGTAIPFYKDIALPVANDLYQGFIMGNPDKSKTLQATLSLAGIDRNGNRVSRERIDNINNTGVPFEVLDDAQLTGGKSVQVNNKSSQVSGQPSVQVARQVASKLVNQPKTTQQETTQQKTNIDVINDYISKLQDVNQPYIDALQNYSNNYDDLVRRNFNAQRYFTAMAGLSGNQGYTKLADALNPINNEANKLNTLKLLRDAQAGDINAINEVMGNLALAKELNLPPEAAFANKNLLTALTANRRQLTDLEKAQIMADIRRYGYDSAFARALQVQGMKGQNALDVANIYMGGGVAPGLNMQGGVQTPYQPLVNKQQGGSNLQQAFDMYANK